MKLLKIILLSIFFLFCLPTSVEAVVNPLISENNKMGIHILDAAEIKNVADLVNSNGGDWGYVVVPIRADDRNREKWNAFMQDAGQKHLIPIIRLASYMTNNYWTKPTKFQIIDFANFLNDLDWPTKNRYVIIYNEPNHAAEWGGNINPQEYGDVLTLASTIFKERSEDFFILPAGLDCAAPNDRTQHMRWDTFLTQMNWYNPQALQTIDGWNSHSYPNYAFSGKPTDRHDHSIYSFAYETALVKNLTGKNYPVFITETGWSNEYISDEKIGEYFITAFNTAWDDANIVTVAPFLLKAGAGDFAKFSLLFPNEEEKPQYKTLALMQKNAGRPVLANSNEDKKVLGINIDSLDSTPVATFSPQLEEEKWEEVFGWFKKLVK
ncbi:hypothetical protein GYA19_04015 [Candidatus Beckwithbacteria bacterium]|nr:hypothetical protein [Candidatus Beckwithbacteria bacterium]